MPVRCRLSLAFGFVITNYACVGRDYRLHQPWHHLALCASFEMGELAGVLNENEQLYTMLLSVAHG